MVADRYNRESTEPDELEREFRMLIDGAWVGSEPGPGNQVQFAYGSTGGRE